MLSFSIGPLALPVAPVLLLLAVSAASWLASRMAAQAGDRVLAQVAGATVVTAALLGLVAARLAHLLLNADAYLAAPWAALDLRDGGWHAATGAAAGASWVAWRGRQIPRLRRPLAGGVLVAAAFWMVSVIVTGLGQARAMPEVALVELGSGRQLDLAQAARGRPVVVNLWASWCGPCRQEMPMLAAAQQREHRVGFLFVNQGESASAVHAYLSDQGLPLREVLLDRGSRLGPAIGSRGLPTTLFYDARGLQVDAHFGVLNAAALDSRLRTLRDPP